MGTVCLAELDSCLAEVGVGGVLGVCNDAAIAVSS